MAAYMADYDRYSVTNATNQSSITKNHRPEQGPTGAGTTPGPVKTEGPLSLGVCEHKRKVEKGT